MSGPTDRTWTSGDEPDRAVLARAFDATAAAYELGRPEYPEEALTFWDDHGAFERGHAVLDLAAGTGKLTRLLPVICDLRAVEPLAQMRASFVAAVPDVQVLDGTAEAIPFDDDHFDTVLVAQAFHWFDQRVALSEIARVLKPGGGLGLIWNEDDVSAASWLADIVDEKRARSASTTIGDHLVTEVTEVTEVIDGHGAFGPVETFECRWENDTTIDAVLADVLSRSYVSALPPADQLGVLTRTREAIERHLGAGVERISYPYRTTAFWAPIAAET